MIRIETPADRRRRDDAWRHIVEDLPDGDERDEFDIPRGNPSRSDKVAVVALFVASAACSLAFIRLAGVLFLGW